MKVFTYFTCGCGENNRFRHGTYVTVFIGKNFIMLIFLSSVNDCIKNNYYAWQSLLHWKLLLFLQINYTKVARLGKIICPGII